MPDGASCLEQALGARLAPEDIARRRALVRETVLQNSPSIRKAQFDRFAPSDVEAVFGLYDRHFYDGTLRLAVGSRALRFRISRRATRRAGSMLTRGQGDATSFEISVSSTLLFGSFREGPSGTWSPRSRPAAEPLVGSRG